MRALAYLAIVFLFVGGVAWIATRLRMWKAEKQPWIVKEKSDDNEVVVYCLQPGTGEQLLLPGSAKFGDPDFDMQIELLRSEARSKLIALNSNRKELT